MCRIIFLISLVLGFSPEVFGRFYFKNNRQKVMSLPIELVNNLIILKVRINDSDTLKFLLDTGVKTSVLTELFPEQHVNLEYQGYVSILGLGGKDTIRAKLSTNNKIQIAGIESRRFNLLSILEHDVKLSPSLGVKINGLIGYDLIKDFVIRIDYAKRRLVFYTYAHFDKLRRYRRWTKLNLSLESYKPYLNLPVKQPEGQIFTAKFLLDIGAGHNLALYYFNDKRLQLPKQKWKAFLGTGLGGTLEGYLGRIDLIDLGPYRLNNVITDFPDKDGIINVAYLYNRQGSIGAGIAKRFNLIINYRDGLLYLKKNMYFKRPFSLNYTGLALKCNFNFPRLYYIAYVVEDSPAYKADFQVGDYLLEINNIKTFNLELSAIYDLFQKKRKYLKIKLLRDNILIKKRISLKYILL